MAHPNKMGKSNLLDSKWRFRGHVVEIFLVILAIILTGVYIYMAPFITRAEIMVIPFGVKSLIIIAYQLLTEHTMRFAKWKSLKASVILNCIEPMFWLAVIVLKFMGISRMCSGSSCGVTWAITVVALIIFALTLQIGAISIREYRDFKRYGSSTAR